MTAPVVADLAGGMRAIVAAVVAEEAGARRRWPWIEAGDGARREIVGEWMLSAGAEPPPRRELPPGRMARQCLPLAVLEAAGWRLVPVPGLVHRSDFLGARMRWVDGEWLAIPPEASPLVARRFSGRAAAPAWMTACHAAGSVPGSVA